jgi:hypothetical protein
MFRLLLFFETFLPTSIGNGGNEKKEKAIAV